MPIFAMKTSGSGRCCRSNSTPSDRWRSTTACSRSGWVPGAAKCEMYWTYTAVTAAWNRQQYRCVAVGRNNWLFAGSDRGGERAALLYLLNVSYRLNDVALESGCDTLSAISRTGRRSVFTICSTGKWILQQNKPQYGSEESLTQYLRDRV